MPNKVVLITGSARRIGLAIAQHFHQQHYDVLIHYHQSARQAQSAIQTLNQQRPDSATGFCADLCTEEAAQTLIEHAITTYGRLDVLINNASVFWPSALDGSELADWSTLFHANVIAPYRLSLAAQPFLAQTQGCIINLTDIHAEKPLKHYALYCQSKAALLMQTKALAREFAPSIRVNSVAPGAIDWPEGINALTEQQKAQIIATTPLQCHGHPRYIAQAIYALAENPFISGENIKIDGGRSLT
ncbi:MAG: pteridine reductase [Legionellaceae bacterium]|nr:pteridine reductase [Legionellaceae bacterium]